LALWGGPARGSGPGPRPGPGVRVFTVTELTRRIQEALRQGLGRFWVEGEVSGLKKSAPGHLYFDLRDAGAVLPCVIWRSTAARLRFLPEEGLRALALGGLEVFEPRGRYQLTVDRLEPQGLGALALRLEQLKRRLAAEGLFDRARKRPIPFLPRRVGVVTSPTGAAVKDMIGVLLRRFPNLAILLCPVRVQGDGAAAEIAEGIARMNRRGDLDVLIVGRGGGSAEDLAAFNEEIVVRAIAASRVPVISAVGHEVDVTLADLAADLRALTPSEAAERAVPVQADLLELLGALSRRMERALRMRLEHLRRRLDLLHRSRGLNRPLERVRLDHQRLDELAARLTQAPRLLAARLRERLGRAGAQLEALDPRRVLERGYSMTLKDGAVVRSVAALRPGDRVTTWLADGEFSSEVGDVHERTA